MATYQTPARVPFGMVSDNRLKQLTSKKNAQNAITAAVHNGKASATQPIVSKRKQDDFFADDVDTENVDPVSFGNSSKKAKTSSNFNFNFSKPATSFVLKSDNSTISYTRPVATPKSRSTLTSSTPLTAPAGRSPPRSKRQDKSKRRSAPFSRISPPSLGLGAGSVPFSIDAALSGSVASYTPAKPRINKHERDSLAQPSKSSSWFFEIHEDTAEQELDNLMDFSTQILDISDDETRMAKKEDSDNKENIAPGTEATVVAVVSRKDKMEDGPRTPLGELEAKEFYADGYDESSVFVVPEDADDSEKPVFVGSDAGAVTLAAAVPAAEDKSPLEHKSNQQAWAEIMARVDEQQKESSTLATPSVETDSADADAFAVEATSRDEAPLFDIWESESAKEEGDNADTNVEALTEGS